MDRNGSPEVSLPAFVPSAAMPSGSDVIQLLRGEHAAAVVVNGIQRLPLQVLAVSDGIQLQLLVVLQPGRTGVPQLLQQVKSQGTTRPNCRVRVLASPWGERHPDLVMLTRGTVEHGSRLRLVFGAGDPMSLVTPACQVVLEPDGNAAYDAETWFQGLWAHAAPLTSEVADAYPRWIQSVSALFAHDWDVYRQTLHELARTETPDAPGDEAEDLGPLRLVDDQSTLFEVAVPPEGSIGNGADNGQGHPDEGAQRSVVAVRQPSDLDGEISALYARGRLVTLELSEKVPTYRLNVAKELGLPLWSKSGRASAASRIRLDLLPAGARNAVEALRREAGEILSRHSFRLAENQHWMLHTVDPYFAKQLSSMNVIEDLSELLGLEIPKYVDREINSLIGSLVRVLRSQKIPVEINDKIFNDLKAAVVSHLEASAHVNVKVSYSTEGLTFTGGQGASYARPFHLLTTAARETRWRLANPDSIAKRETEGPPLSTLDVVGGDRLLRGLANGNVADIALSHRREIDQIAEEGPSERGCRQLMELLRRDYC